MGEAMAKKKGRFKSQLYVDDPALTFTGTKTRIRKTLDAVLLFWLILGMPLAWKEGSFFMDNERHTWIGVLFSISEDGRACMQLPSRSSKNLILSSSL